MCLQKIRSDDDKDQDCEDRTVDEEEKEHDEDLDKNKEGVDEDFEEFILEDDHSDEEESKTAAS